MIKSSLFSRADTPNYQARIVMPDGKVLKRSTGKSNRPEAEKWLADWVEELKWRDKLGMAATTRTVGWIWDNLVEAEVSDKPAYGSAYRKWIDGAFGDRAIDTIKSSEIKVMLKDAKISPARRACIGTVMRRIIKTAVERDWVSEGNAPRVPSTSYKSGTRPEFPKEDVTAILAGLKADREGGWRRTDKDSRWLLWAYCSFLRHTGMRPGREVETLRFMDVHSELDGNKPYLRIQIHPHNTKVRRARDIISESALVPIWEELREWQAQWGNDKPTGLIFADRRGTVRRFSNEVFRRALIRLEMLKAPDGKERSLYCFRHHYISEHVRAGVPLTAIAKQAGNSPAIISATYDKSIPKDFMKHFIK